jgi:hypothetical protein
VGVLSVDDHVDFSTMSNFRVGIHWMGVSLASGCDPLRHYSLWTHSGHDGWKIMIRVAKHQRGGSFLWIDWDSGTSVGDSVAAHTEARASFFLHEIGSLAEKFLGGSIKLL